MAEKPSRLALYLNLIRWDRPAGSYLLLWPTLAALWIAQGGDDGAFVAARRFADDLHGAPVRGDPRPQRGVAGGVVFEGEERAGEMPGEGGLGDIEAEMDQRWSHGLVVV